MNRLNGVSMFSGGGVGETYFEQAGIDIKVANELLPERANFYRLNHPKTKMIQGDINNPAVLSEFIETSRALRPEFLIATPPCQGMSTLGRKEYETDKRNLLIFKAIDAIKAIKPAFVLIENVPKFNELHFPYEGKSLKIVDLLKASFSNMYVIDAKILNAEFYGVPQSRPRLIIKMYRPNYSWGWPKMQKIITLREAIGDLPSLEAGQDSGIKWHKAPPISNHFVIEALQHTEEGHSAMANLVYYPKKLDGTRIKGFHNTYARMHWDQPAPARTMNNNLVSGHNNVHPGRLLQNGLWSDARALTLRELIIVSSLPLTWVVPDEVKETVVRQIIGEAIPPRLSYEIVRTLTEVDQ